MPTPKSLQVDIDFNQSKKWKYSENLMIALKQQESEANPVLISMSTKQALHLRSNQQAALSLRKLETEKKKGQIF
jgi:predicted neuraminidase